MTCAANFRGNHFKTGIGLVGGEAAMKLAAVFDELIGMPLVDMQSKSLAGANVGENGRPLNTGGIQNSGRGSYLA